MRKSATTPASVIVISDTHCGCRMGLCPDTAVALDGGGSYHASRLQLKVWGLWREFWDQWVPMVTKGEPYIVVFNGDALDGVHHGTKTQISHNHVDQQSIAMECLRPVVAGAHSYYHIRGTEAHVGQSGEHEESLARALGAIPDEDGNHARWNLWLDLKGHLCHFTHHIGTVSSMAYETTAPHKEMVEMFNDSGKHDRQPPQVLVRSHRHRHVITGTKGAKGQYISVVTPAWQLKTPFSHRIPGARATEPEIGGVLIRVGSTHGLFADARVWSLDRPKPEVFG